jgi:hypothetical protein
MVPLSRGHDNILERTGALRVVFYTAKETIMRTMIPIFVASVLTITSANAEDKDKSMAREETTFKALDRDSDQRLSKSEATGDKMLTDHFAMIDADADGYLTKREYTAHIKDMKSPKKNDY